MQLIILALVIYFVVNTPKCLYRFSERVNDTFTMDNEDFKSKYYNDSNSDNE